MTATSDRSITIRRAPPADSEALAETAIAAWRVGFAGLVPAHVDPRRAWRPERLAARLAGTADDGSEILAAELERRVCGLVLLGPCRDPEAAENEAEIVALYVHPDRWREGVGRSLVAGALDRLEAAGHREVIVWTLAGSARNRSFYEALGFTSDGGTQRRPSFGNPLEVRFRMALGERPSTGDG